MATAGEVLGVIARVRRAMPRNADVMLLCETLEHCLLGMATQAQVGKPEIAPQRRQLPKRKKARA